MEIINTNGNIRKWNKIKDTEIKKGIIKGMNKHNSKLCIDILNDFENGINTTTKGKRTPSSLLRIYNNFRWLSDEAKTNELEKINRKQLRKICDIKNSETFVRNVKCIYTWMKRTGKINENISEHLISNNVINQIIKNWTII